MMDLAGAAANQERSKDALVVYREALDLREKLFGSQDQLVAERYAAIARVYQTMNDQAQARRTMQYALEIRQQAGQEQSAGFADLLEDSASLYDGAQDRKRCQSEYERAIAIRERLWGTRDPRFVASLKKIAQFTEFGIAKGFAETLYRRVVDIEKSVHTEKSEAYYDALIDFAACVQTRKRFREAEETFEWALAVRRNMGKKDAKAALCLEYIARCRLARGMYKEAAEAAEASIELRKQVEKPGETSEVPLDALLAEAYLRAHDRQKSETYFRAMYSQIKPAQDYTLIQTAEKLSTIYEERGDYPQAATKLEMAVGAIETANFTDARLPEKEIHLAQLYQRMGRMDDANRMNMAALHAMSRTVQAQGGTERLKYVLIGFFVVLVGLPVGGGGNFCASVRLVQP
jgi:tetratricopeptide (TPR) repeat protein